MSTEAEVIIAELKRIQDGLEAITRRLSKIELGRQFEARAFTLQQASKLLSQGMTKTRLMVKRGQLATIKVGRRTMVTMREIERLTTEPEPDVITKPKRAPKVAPKSSGDLREWLKTQRKKRQ